MTTETNFEALVAESARAWREASRGEDAGAPESTERAFADNLERWIAELLTTDEAWTLRGRWFDGLIFQECRAEEDERFTLSGYIWSIDQEQWPFLAELQLSPEGMTDFNVLFGGREPDESRGHRRSRRLSLPSADSDWAFQFVRSG